MVRVFELAMKLGMMNPKVLVSKLIELGYDVKDHNSEVDEDVVDDILKRLTSTLPEAQEKTIRHKSGVGTTIIRRRPKAVQNIDLQSGTDRFEPEGDPSLAEAALLSGVSKTTKIRVYELAKEAEMENKDFVAALIEMGYAIKSYSSTLEDDIAQEIRLRLGIGPARMEEKRMQTRSGTTVIRRRPKALKNIELQAVTDRFEPGVTNRFIPSTDQSDYQDRPAKILSGKEADPNRITAKFNQSPADFSYNAKLPVGTFVDDRYRVEAGPLGVLSGEAEIYRCLDSSTGDQVVLKFYLVRMRPKQGVMEKLCGLRHPDIVSILHFGLWEDRFYEVMEYCAGGTLVENLPINEGDLRRMLPEMVNGIQFLHGQGIVHRDIKPNNIYFRRPGRQDLVIGDFGISSLVAADESEGILTSTYNTFTLHYAPPELVFKGEVSHKTDYYSLGMTLIHALLGHSPFEDMAPIDIRRVLYSGIPTIPPLVSAETRQLLVGLTQREAANRWGYAQVWQWRHGQEIMTDAGLPWREGQFSLTRDSYARCEKATNPRELASHLDEFDAAADLFHGYIRGWVFHFDPKAADRIQSIEEDYEDKPELALAKLAFLLDPSLPLVLNDRRQATSIEDLIEFLTSDPELSLSQALVDALYSERLECWLEETQEINDKEKLLGNLAALRIRLKARDMDIRLVLFALLHTLAPQTPLVFRDGVSIAKLEDLEESIAQSPGLETKVGELLFDGRLAEWLLAAFPERQDDFAFLHECPKRYANDHKLGVWVLRWRIKPSLAFPFGNENAADAKALVALIDRNAQGNTLGLELLQNGWIQAWLETTGRLPDADGFSNLVNNTAHTWRARLETVLHLLDPSLPWPTPETDLQALNGGWVSAEAFETVPLTVSNSGRGYLTGLITLTGDNGITLHTSDCAIEGRPLTVEIQCSALGLPLGSRPRALITVQTPGGNIEVPVTFRVRAPLVAMIGRSIRWGLVWGGGLGFFRLVAGTAAPDFSNRVMTAVTWEQINTIQNGDSIMLSRGIFGLVLAVFLGGAGYYLVRMLDRRGNVS